MSIREANRVVTAAIAASSSGQNTIISVPTGQKVIVLSYVLVAAGAVTAQWESGTTDLSGAMSLAANGGISAQGTREAPLLKTVDSGDDLILTLGGAVSVAGHISYIAIAAITP